MGFFDGLQISIKKSFFVSEGFGFDTGLFRGKLFVEYFA